MSHLHRRSFLGTSLNGLAALAFYTSARGQEVSQANGNASVSSSGPDTLFLTWQRDPTTTMTIQWVGPASADSPSPGPSAVQFAPLDAELWENAVTSQKPFPDTDLRVHRCELTGLSPGTEYRFRIGGEPAVHRFRTMPAKATNVIQFVSGGDSGTGSHAIATNILAAKQEPYFAFLGGDLAYDNGRSPDTFLSFLRNYSHSMVDAKGRKIPILAGIGNHEVNGGYAGARDKAAHYLSVFDGFYPEKTFGVMDIGDYLSLVLLDSGHVAPVGGEQTEWLETVLRDRQDRSHLIVAHHVPAYPSFRSPEGERGTGSQSRQHWCPLFEKHKVDLVLEHHDHTFKRTHPLTDGMKDKNGVLYLGDGSWGKLRAPKPPEERPYLAAVDQAYHLTVHRFEGDQRFHVALEDTGRVADVCMTTSKRLAR